MVESWTVYRPKPDFDPETMSKAEWERQVRKQRKEDELDTELQFRVLVRDTLNKQDTEFVQGILDIRSGLRDGSTILIETLQENR